MGRLPASVVDARRLLKDFGATAVIGVGGYASGPVVLAAWLMGLPTAICEQNSVAGITNRILGKLVRRVYTTFPASTPFFPAGKVAMVGNPVRKRFRDAVAASSLHTAGSEDFLPGRLFVFGGSQGARPLNETMPAAAKLVAERVRDRGLAISVLHQAGRDAVDGVRSAYADAGVDAEVTPFIDDMVSAYRAADVVVCRAGATSCAEVTALGVPAILVPFPQAADDHQTMNAMDLVRQDAAAILHQKDMTPIAMADAIVAIIGDRDRRSKLAAAARAAGRLSAAAVIADAVAAGFPAIATTTSATGTAATTAPSDAPQSQASQP